jgi:hypothetical protein
MLNEVIASGLIDGQFLEIAWGEVVSEKAFSLT